MSDALWAEVLKLSQSLVTLQHAHNGLVQRFEAEVAELRRRLAAVEVKTDERDERAGR